MRTKQTSPICSRCGLAPDLISAALGVRASNAEKGCVPSSATCVFHWHLRVTATAEKHATGGPQLPATAVHATSWYECPQEKCMQERQRRQTPRRSRSRPASWSVHFSGTLDCRNWEPVLNSIPVSEAHNLRTFLLDPFLYDTQRTSDDECEGMY